MDTWKDPETAKKILTDYRVFAVVGCSADPRRPSNSVTKFLIDHGYEVVCVNPNETVCLPDVPCYPDLASIPDDVGVEVVDIFRRADAAGVHVDEAIEIGAKAVWMQLGVIDEDAAARAKQAGLDVVMDRCPAIDHPRLIKTGGSSGNR